MPATAEWVAEEIAKSTAVLSGPMPNAPGEYDKRREAAQQLRYLDTPGSRSASLALMPAEEYTLLRGLAATREPVPVCKAMQEAVTAPAQAVSSYYLYAMFHVCARAHSIHEAAALQKYQAALTTGAMSDLAGSLPRKAGEPKRWHSRLSRNACRTCVINSPSVPLPDWIPAVTAEFVKSYPALSVTQQQQLLSLYVNTLPSPAMLPLLDAAMDAWKPGDYYEAPREALANLATMDPKRAQTRILAELRKSKSWLNATDLDKLPLRPYPLVTTNSSKRWPWRNGPAAGIRNSGWRRSPDTRVRKRCRASKRSMNRSSSPASQNSWRISCVSIRPMRTGCFIAIPGTCRRRRHGAPSLILNSRRDLRWGPCWNATWRRT